MTFQEAKDKLKQIANGKHHSLSYLLREYPSGLLEAECYLYISQGDSSGIDAIGSTWVEAFSRLNKKLLLISEMPGEELGKEGG